MAVALPPANNFSTRIVARHFSSNRTMRYGIAMAMLLGGNDDHKDIGSMMRGLRYSGNAAINIGTFSKFIDAINEIDDRLDTMSAEDILAAAKTPQDFLKNPKIMTPANWQVFDDLTTKGIYTQKDLTLFMNLFADMHITGAEAALKLKQDPLNVELREQASEQHLRSAELTGIMFTHIYRPEHLRFDEKPRYEDAAKAYPDTVRISRIIEYNDDLMDFFEDYADELKTGTPNPNTVMTEFTRIIAKRSPEDRQKAIADLNSYVTRVTQPRRHIHFGDIPHDLKLAMYEVVRHSEAEAKQLCHPDSPSLMRDLAYNLSIDVVGSNLREGWPVPRDKTMSAGR